MTTTDTPTAQTAFVIDAGKARCFAEEYANNELGGQPIRLESFTFDSGIIEGIEQLLCELVDAGALRSPDGIELAAYVVGSHLILAVSDDTADCFQVGTFPLSLADFGINEDEPQTGEDLAVMIAEKTMTQANLLLPRLAAAAAVVPAV